MSNEKESIFSAKNLKYLTSPFSANNPVIVQILGICSALAVTVQMKPAIVMALSVAVVTGFSSMVIVLPCARRAFAYPYYRSAGRDRRAGDSRGPDTEGIRL